MNIGTLIKGYRQKNGISLRDFAAKCGTSHSYIAMLEAGKNSKTGEPIIPTLTFLKKLAIGLNISVNDLITMCEDIEVSTDNESIPMNNFIPVLGDVAAGIPIEAVTDIIDYEEISPDLLSNGSEYFALRIKGKSMQPKIDEGDVVIVRKQPDVDSGQIAIVGVNGDNATCKKVIKQEKGILLISLNHAYEPIFYSYEDIKKIPITILGRVVELRAKF